MQTVQSYYTTLRTTHGMAGNADTSSATLCTLLRLSMASARLHLRTSVAVHDAMLAIRMMEESTMVKSGGDPVLLLGRHMTDMVTEPGSDGRRLDFDSYLDVLADSFAPRPAQAEE